MNNNEYIQNLIEQLQNVKYSNEFINNCIRYSQNLLKQSLPVIFDDTHVNLILRIPDGYLSTESIHNSYHTFYINNHSKIRTITAPSVNLKKRQRWILDNILYKKESSIFAHGFEPNKSIVTNAMQHINNEYVVCIDIKDFFPSIKNVQVEEIFQQLGYTKSASSRLTELCCIHGALPQGAPTSPHLANIICSKLDLELNNIAQKYSCCYTRYADDITFSSKNDIKGIISEIQEPISRYGFNINSSKTSFFTSGKPKFITGLIVQNGKMRVPKRYKRELKKEIYYCKKFGVSNHLNNIKSKKFINYREYLYGKAYYIHMVEKEEGTKFLNQLDEISWPNWSL